MATRKNLKTKKTKVQVERQEVKTSKTNKQEGLVDKLQMDLQSNQSLLNLVLGGLIIIVLGVLLYNYFNNREAANLGPSQQTENEQQGDVTKDSLPGKYTVKEGDTLFSIAETYYNDGYQYPKLVEANKLANENAVEVGQVLEIPKLDQAMSASESPSATPSSSPSTEPTMSPTPSPSASPEAMMQNDNGTGGATNQTQWGEKISSDTYTVQAGDWLSKIAARTYGDPMAYQKIAQANNISNPDTIEVGMVLKLPR